jgi:hypothetical protein
MNKNLKHIIRTRLALLLLAVFVGSMLVKPTHILLLHHESPTILYAHSQQQTISAEHHENCAICDFEFCSFILQKQQSLPTVSLLAYKEQILRTVAGVTSLASHQFQLRAPPCL